jgi:hypothetical protein
MIEISEHAYQRGKERLGLSRKAFARLAERAYLDGMTHKDVHGRLHKYLTKLI